MYLAIPVRNAGMGLAVLHGWHPIPEWRTTGGPRAEPEEFRRLTRDLYVPVGDVGFWQGALRDPSEPIYAGLRAAVEGRERFTIDVLYGDHEGGRRTISRFAVLPGDDGRWFCSVGRVWNPDRADPR